MPDLLVVVKLRSRQRGNRGRTAVRNALLQQRFGPPAFRFKLPDRPPDLVMAFILSHAKTAEDPAVLTFYLMELSCKDFLHQHAFSRGLSCGGDLIEKIMECANSLAGEPLKEEDMITALSGGQSRALMIAYIAWLSEAPVVLIDEQ